MIQRALNRAIDLAMTIAEIAIVVMMLHITAELVIRWLFSHGLESVPEFVAYYYMTSVAFLSLAYVTRGNGHLAAEFFTEHLSARHRRILDGAISIWLGLFMLLLTWQLAREAVTMTAIQEVHQGVSFNLPKWPGRWIMAIGSAIMTAYAFALGTMKLFGGASEEEVRPRPGSLD
jgi:TRAP-type C4-dicarboxylate transport system permease small subunit